MSTAKTQRLDARLTAERKDTLEHAAALLRTVPGGDQVKVWCPTGLPGISSDGEREPYRDNRFGPG